MADYRTKEIIGTVINAMTATAVTVATDEYSGNTNSTVISNETSGNAEGAYAVDVWVNVTANSGNNAISVYAEKSLNGTNYATKGYANSAKNNGAVISTTGWYYCGKIYNLPKKMKLQARVEDGTSATVAIYAYPLYAQSAEVV